ncbi:hypothetical protein Nepgr_005501 [Nepenthes gracilis]|uniref:Nuclear pore complex NUP2/50/61 domain-containing protein n=1 Tax=Nepenthes gracilis TaxID=150966 RepID=A0AAD3S3R3_NEPGR|nr:hypothetical protein Nepgr_005501 [Nepenthes gracilis]
MGDENALPSSKKRAAGREISKDNPGLDDEEDVPEEETGTFKRASDDVLAGRRIVKVRRHQTSTPASAPTANPFSGIRLIPPPIVAAASPEATAETQVGGEKMAADEVDQNAKTNNGSKKETILNDNDSQKKTDEAAVKSDAERNNADTAEKEAEANSADQKEAAEGAEKTDKAKPADQKEGEGDKANIDDGKEENPAAEKTEVDNAQNEGKKDDNNPDAGGESAPFSSFQQLSSNQNAFTGLAGTGFANSTFSFGSLPKDGSPSGSGLGPFQWSKTDPSSIPPPVLEPPTMEVLPCLAPLPHLLGPREREADSHQCQRSL